MIMLFSVVSSRFPQPPPIHSPHISTNVVVMIMIMIIIGRPPFAWSIPFLFNPIAPPGSLNVSLSIPISSPPQAHPPHAAIIHHLSIHACEQVGGVREVNVRQVDV